MVTSVRRCRVLLVEDNPADVRLMQEAFREAPDEHDLQTAVDGEEALDMIFARRQHADKLPPDIVLLDINLPKLNGHEVLQAMKSAPDLMRIPVVMLSGSRSNDDVLKAYDHHANAYLTKPTDLSDYLHIVAAVKRFWCSVVQLPERV
jgi:two-component system, chemotaxis family, response regulator Rcp1